MLVGYELETVRVMLASVVCEQEHNKSGAVEEDGHRETTAYRWLADNLLHSYLHHVSRCPVLLLHAKAVV